MKVKVSVILPSLNVASYIEEAVRSAMGQTLQEIEILCIDAGSEDGTWEILSGLAKEDERVILRRSAVKSYGYQVNMGIDMARGEYIAILETDDYAKVHMYGRLYHEAVLHDCDYVKCDYAIYRTQEDGKRIFLERHIFQTDELYGRIIEPVKYLAVATEDNYLWNGIYRKEFLNRHSIRLAPTPGAAYQDIGFVYQTNIHGEKALYLKESCYCYCTDREGASANSGMGLKYAYQEYLRLYQKLQAEGGGEGWLPTFYCRMAKSFIYCCEGMEEGKMRIDGAEKSAYYGWFSQRLKEALEHNMADRGVFHPEAWKKLEMLLVSEDYYTGQCKSRKKKIKDTLGEPGGHPVIIFGSGHYGHEACKWLEERGYSAACFTDNNQTLWGTKVNNREVMPPKKAREQFGMAKYVIANEKHWAEMKAQLLNMGVSENDICMYV